MYFMGTYTPKLDDKGRLILPAKFREQLAEGLVVTQGQEKCLDVWPESDFMAEAERAEDAGHDLDDAAATTPGCCSPAPSRATPDKQGRISLTPSLREYAAHHPRRRGDRRHGPRRDLGAGPLARVLRVRPGEVRRARRGTPRPTDDRPTKHHRTTTAQGLVGRGLGPLLAPSSAARIWGTFPGSRRHDPAERPETWPYESRTTSHRQHRAPAHTLMRRVEPMSTYLTTGDPLHRRVRHQAREAVALMAFSARHLGRARCRAAPPHQPPARLTGGGRSHDGQPPPRPGPPGPGRRSAGALPAASRGSVHGRRHAGTGRPHRGGAHPAASWPGSSASTATRPPSSWPAPGWPAFGDRFTGVHAVYDELPDVLDGPRAWTRSTRCSSTSASPRCSSTSASAASPTPRTRRSTCGWTARRGPTAADVLNTYSAAELTRVLREYGEERFARRIAAAVVRRREQAPFTTSAAAGRAAVRRDPRAGPPDRRAPGQAHLPGAADGGQRRARGAAPRDPRRHRRDRGRRPGRRRVLPLPRGPARSSGPSPQATRSTSPSDLPFVPEGSAAGAAPGHPGRRAGRRVRDRRRTRGPPRCGCAPSNASAPTFPGSRSMSTHRRRRSAFEPRQGALRGRRRTGPAHRRPAPPAGPGAADAVRDPGQPACCSAASSACSASTPRCSRRRSRPRTLEERAANLSAREQTLHERAPGAARPAARRAARRPGRHGRPAGRVHPAARRRRRGGDVHAGGPRQHPEPAARRRRPSRRSSTRRRRS